MRIRTGGVVLILGRHRKDGWRCVYAVRLSDWSLIQRLLRKAKIKNCLVGERLFVRAGNPRQRLFAFLESVKPEELIPCSLIAETAPADHAAAHSKLLTPMTPP
jgi:hypothetical protein